MSRQIVLMTGSSSGIGLATAARLARDPDQRFIVIATVIALAEKADLVAAVGDALDKTVFIMELDITKDDNITSVVGDVIRTHGRIDILMNIAGIAVLNVPERVTRKEIDHIFGVNLTGTIRLTQAVLPHMKKKRAGKIVVFSSTAGRIGFPCLEFYAASKFGLEGFFESLSAGVKSFNIRVCIIEPGAVETNMTVEAPKELVENSKEETLDEIDRRRLARFAQHLQAMSPVHPDDFADDLVRRCLDVDEPDLRHLMCEDRLKELIAQSVADLSGQTAITIMLKND